MDISTLTQIISLGKDFLGGGDSGDGTNLKQKNIDLTLISIKWGQILMVLLVKMN